MAVGDDRRSQRDVTGRIDQPVGTARSLQDLMDFERRIIEQNRTAPQSGAPVVSSPQRPGGDDSGIRMIQGLDGILQSNVAVSQEIGGLTAEVKILNDRQRTMYGQTVSQVDPQVPMDQSALVDAFKAAIDQSMTTLKASLPASAAPASASTSESRVAGTSISPDWLPGPGPAPTSPRMEASPSRSAQNLAGVREGLPEDTPGQDQRVLTPRESFAAGQEQYSMKGLRERVGRDLSKRLTEKNPNPEGLVPDPLGNLRYPSSVPGEFGDLASEESLRAMELRGKMLGAGQGAAGALADGGTLKDAGLGLIGGVASKALGGLGVAVAGINKAADFAENQRAENNKYISMLGGGQAGAVEERLSSKVFQLSQFGSMSSQESGKLFEGVAATGMSDENRKIAEDFAVDNYKTLGMSVQDSLEIVNVAAKTNQESLTGVATALQDVSEAAAEADINTQAARDAFVENWKAYSEVFTGETATSLAGAIGVAQTDLGAEFQDVDMSGSLTPEKLRIIGAQSGMGLNEMIGMSSQPGGEERLLRMLDKSQTQILGSTLTTGAKERISEGILGRENPNEALSDPEMDVIKQDLLSDPSYNIPDLDTLVQTYSQLGVQGLTVDNVLDYVIRQRSGQFRPDKKIADEISGQTRNLGDPYAEFDETVEEGLSSTQAIYGGSIDPAYREQAAEESPEWEDTRDKIDMDSVAGEAWYEDALRTGRVGGISQMLVEKEASYGVENVTVNTADGARVVSLEEAMLDFRDQIDRGDIKVAGGDSDGLTLADVTGATGDSSVDAMSAEDEELGGVGVTQSVFDAKQKDRGSSSGTVTIYPSDELRKYFEFVPTGAAEVDDPAASRQPAPTDVTPFFRALTK